jgi:hypothetical protein
MEVDGVPLEPAVRHASPTVTQAFAVVALPLKVSAKSDAPVGGRVGVGVGGGVGGGVGAVVPSAATVSAPI